jgi:hypothetical protein
MALPQVFAGLTKRLASGGFANQHTSFLAPVANVLQGFISTSSEALAPPTATKKVAAGEVAIRVEPLNNDCNVLCFSARCKNLKKLYIADAALIPDL